MQRISTEIYLKTHESRISQCGARALGDFGTFKRVLATTVFWLLLTALASLRAGPQQGGH